jgi:hypothetical protein
MILAATLANEIANGKGLNYQLCSHERSLRSTPLGTFRTVKGNWK